MTSGKILVVEDEKNIRIFLEHLLKREGLQVTVASKGEVALTYLDKEVFDLAILDLNLGKGINGMDVLVGIKEKSPSTSVILLTGQGTLETAIQALRQGAHDYLLKPCEANEIRASVQKALLKKQKEQQNYALLNELQQDLEHRLDEIRTTLLPNVGPGVTSPSTEPKEIKNAQQLQCGDLVVDLVRHMITINGRFVTLSPLEFELLAYLVSKAPRVVSSQDIMVNVHGYDVESWEASDVVRTHIYRIRQKIKKETGRGDIINTVRGIGYTINGQAT